MGKTRVSRALKTLCILNIEYKIEYLISFQSAYKVDRTSAHFRD